MQGAGVGVVGAPCFLSNDHHKNNGSRTFRAVGSLKIVVADAAVVGAALAVARAFVGAARRGECEREREGSEGAKHCRFLGNRLCPLMQEEE